MAANDEHDGLKVDRFTAGLAKYLAEVEKHTIKEVRRLEVEVAHLTRENVKLTQQLQDSELRSANGTAEQAEAVKVKVPELTDACCSPMGAPMGLTISPGGSPQTTFVTPGGTPTSAMALPPGAVPPINGEDPAKAAGQIGGTTDGGMLSWVTGTESAKARKARIRGLIHNSVAETSHDKMDLYYETGYFQAVAKADSFETATMLVVVANAIWISIDLDLNDGKNIIFPIADNAFCTLFTGELIVRLMACQRKLIQFLDPWFLFDFALVFMMVLETWVMPVVFAATGMEGGAALSNASVLRLLRLLRITRMGKAMRALPELMVMLKGMAIGIRAAFATILMMCAITYLFAVVFRQLTNGRPSGEEFFSSVPKAVYTLLLEAVLPENGDTLTFLGYDAWYLGILFFVFILLGSLTVMNMLIGVMCEVMTTTSADKNEVNELQAMASKLKEILEGLDLDFDGSVSRKELDAILDNDDAIMILGHVGIDVNSLVDDADIMFEDYGEAGLTYIDFIEALSEFRASHGSTMRCLSSLRKYVRKTEEESSEKLLVIEGALAKILKTQEKASRRDELTAHNQRHAKAEHAQDGKQENGVKSRLIFESQDPAVDDASHSLSRTEAAVNSSKASAAAAGAAQSGGGSTLSLQNQDKQGRQGPWPPPPTISAVWTTTEVEGRQPTLKDAMPQSDSVGRKIWVAVGPPSPLQSSSAEEYVVHGDRIILSRTEQRSESRPSSDPERAPDASPSGFRNGHQTAPISPHAVQPARPGSSTFALVEDAGADFSV